MSTFKKSAYLYAAVCTVSLCCNGAIAGAVNIPKDNQFKRFELECEALERQLNEDVKDNDFDKALKTEITRVLNPKLWYNFSGTNWTIDKVTDRLTKTISGPSPLLLGPQAEKLILRLRKHLDCVSNHLSENWTKEYIQKIEKLNKRQIHHRDYEDAKQSIRSSIESLTALTQRLRTIDDVHNQHLEGIPKHILVLGMAQSTDPDNVRNIEVYRNIRDSAETYLSASRSITLLSSQSKLTSKGFVQKITHHESSKVEDSGANPTEYTDSETDQHYVLQKYKIFPVFPKPGIVNGVGEKVNDQVVDRLAAQKATISWHKAPTYFLIKDADDKNIPGDYNSILRRNAREMLDQIESDNLTSQNRVQSSEKNFTSNRHDIYSRRELELQNLNEFIQNAISMIVKLDPTVNFVRLHKHLDDIINSSADDIEKIENIWGAQINNILHKRMSLFSMRVETAKAEFENHIRKRPLIIFTREDEIQSDDISRKQLAVKLAEKAIRSLCLRQKSLVSYRVSVFQNGRLESQRADKYYDSGTITASIMVSPVVQFINYLDGKKPRVSVLLAHEIQFKRARIGSSSVDAVAHCDVAGTVAGAGSINAKTQAKAVEQVDPAQKKGFRVTDMNAGLEWLLMPLKRCRSKYGYEKELLKGFATPSLPQLLLLKEFLKSTTRADIKRRFGPLLREGRYLWSNKSRSLLKRKYLVFNLKSSKEIYDASDACNFGVGVRPFG